MRCDDLIFDVGMHRGEDTGYYLARGYRVVAVEANPDLVDTARRIYADAIADGRLTIVNAAVADHAGEVDFAVGTTEATTIWSSANPDFVAHKTALGVPYRTIRVPAVSFRDLLARYGVPHFVKLSIVGDEMLCIRALHDYEERPTYLALVSAVTWTPFAPEAIFDELAHLWVLGYRQFKYVNLRQYGAGDNSGPFGEETPGRWTSVVPMVARAPVLALDYQMTDSGSRWGRTIFGRAYGKFRRDLLHRPVGWYALHAKLNPG